MSLLRREHAEKYPECTKLSSTRRNREEVQAFLDWLKDKGVELCEKRMGEWGVDHYPIMRTEEKLLMEYFEIDENKLEKERRAILDEQRKLNEKR